MGKRSGEGHEGPSRPWNAAWRRFLSRPVPALIAALPGSSRALTAAVAGGLLVETLLAPAFAIASGALVGTVPDAVRHGVGSPAGHRLIVALVVVVVLFAAQQVVPPLRGALAGALGRRLQGRLKEQVMADALSPPGIAHLEDPSLLDLVARAQAVTTGDVTPTMAVTAGSTLAANRLGGVASAALLVSLHWWLAAGLVAGSFLVAYWLMGDLRKNLAALGDEAERFRRSAYFRDLAVTPAAAKEVRVFGLPSWVLDHFAGEWRQAMQRVWAERRRRRWNGPGGGIALFALNAAAVAVVARAAFTGDLSLGRFVMLLQAVAGARRIFNFRSGTLNVGYGAAALPGPHELHPPGAPIPPPPRRHPPPAAP